MKVALVYDRVNKWGGAERVLLALHKIFPDAPLFTSVYDKKNAKWAEVFDIRTSYLQKYKFARSHTEWLAALMPSVFESFDFDEYDLVISVTSEAAKGIITKPGTLHICYCLTPTRYLWSGHLEYFKNNLLKIISIPIIFYLRKWDLTASSRPDFYISISNEVKNRVKKYYKKDSKIIYPPLAYLPKSGKKLDEEYYLLVSRLSKFSYYKKVNLALDVFNKLGWKLKVVGSGPMLAHFKNRSKENIEFLGELTDEDLAYYYENCKALVFPGFEDFGLVMVEAQSFGKPVIAYGKGGALDIIKNGVTGELFDFQTTESFEKALKKFNNKRYNKADIVANSERFTYEKFKKDFEEFIDLKN